MATRKKTPSKKAAAPAGDKIDKLVDKYKKKSAPIKAREAANQAAKARQLPVKSGASSVTTSGGKELVKSGGRSVASSTGSKALKTVLSPGTKLAARAGLVGLAGYAGYKVGQAINKKFNISGWIVDKLMEKKDQRVNAMLKSTSNDLPDRGPGGVKLGKSPTGNGAKASSAPQKASSTPNKTVKTKGGNYPIYKKTSNEAKEFRSAFAAARKAGKKEFTWQGRKYNTKVK